MTALGWLVLAACCLLYARLVDAVADLETDLADLARRRRL